MNFFEHKKYKKILEECILIPFKSLIHPNINILPGLINFNIPLQDFKTSHFSITLQYGTYNWTIKKNKYKIYTLCNELSKRGIQIKSYNDLGNLFSVTRSQIENIISEIIEKMRFFSMLEIFTFFRISKYSFYGLKLFEEKFHISCKFISSECCCFYNRQTFKSYYLVCKSTHMILIDFKKNFKVTKIFFYKKNFDYKISRGTLKTSLNIVDGDKVYKITSLHKERVELLFEEIQNCMYLYYNSITMNNFQDYSSFSPLRHNNIVNFFVDGKNYFEDLYFNLKKAKTEIFLAGWWIFPKLFLKRSKKGLFKKKYRLDFLLKSVAERGVKIYILIYHEIQFTVSINSQYTYDIFNNLHSNITIIRHPQNAPNNFIYWTNHEKIVVIDQKISYIGGIDLCLGRYDTKNHFLFDIEKNFEIKKNKKKIDFIKKYEGILWPGMDFYNPLKRDFKFLDRAEKSLIDRRKIPRMPWHDIQIKIIGGSAFDISLHFIQRWNFVVADNLLIPNEMFLSNKNNNIFPYVTCQALRSIGRWSIDEPTENSIYKKYLEIIKNSKKFLYFENQFFITNSVDDVTQPKNLIGLEIVNRIIQAHKKNEKFKVYIVIPILPAFELNISLEMNSTLMHILKLQSECIKKNNFSLINVLKSEGINYKDYIVFLSLQKYQKNDKDYHIEQIYVHSKIIIADGTKMIIGSANINDRSLLGNRDTEIGLYIEDYKFNEIQSLLKNLFMEHLNIKSFKKKNQFMHKFFNEKILKLESDEFFFTIQNVAYNNTKLYSSMFSNFLSNEIKTFFAYNKALEKKDEVKKEDFDKILGNFVLYPFKFLIDEDLESGFLSLNSIIPEEIYY